MRKIGLLPYLFVIFFCNSCKINDQTSLDQLTQISLPQAPATEDARRSIAANMAEIEELYDDLFRLRNNLKLKTIPGEISNNIDQIILCFADCRKSIPEGIHEQYGSPYDGGPSHEIQAYTGKLEEIIELFILLREAAVSQDLDNYNKILYEIDEIKRKSHSRFG